MIYFICVLQRGVVPVAAFQNFVISFHTLPHLPHDPNSHPQPATEIVLIFKL
jgi:hypothetical protein